MKNTVLVTGGAGFIGGTFVRRHVECDDVRVINLDKLTYAGDPSALPVDNERHQFVNGDIGDRSLIKKLLNETQPAAIVNFAAESHVDRSIDGPLGFVDTNVVGTCRLLEETRAWWSQQPAEQKAAFRFLHVSTDEVYGSLGPEDPRFTESTSFKPNSPYAASKAASDHFVRAYYKTYGLPTVITNCSNNYGPFQFPEKLIPLVTLNAIDGKPLPVYGDGSNIRDWLHVEDHCRAIDRVLEKGTVGQTYNIGADTEKTNLQIVTMICDILDELDGSGNSRAKSLITFTTDRPGHDKRYAVDTTRISSTLDWHPEVSFEDGLRETVEWYRDNRQWVQQIESGDYQRQRLGMGGK